MRPIISFFLSALISFSLLLGFILAVDPYNKFGFNLFGLKTKAVDFARVNKYNQVEHGKKNYQAFLMGSSSAHRFETQVIQKLSGYEAYNYSTQSATPEDYLAMTRHILTKYQPKLILLSLDFEVMNVHTKTDDMFYASPLKNYLNEAPAKDLGENLLQHTYLTLEAIRDSFKVIWVNLFGKARHAYLEDGNHIKEPKPSSLKLSQVSTGEFKLDEKRLGYLKELRRLGEQHGFKIIAFTSPLSYEHYQMVYGKPELAEALAQLKLTLAQIFGELYDFQTESMKTFNSTDYFENSNHANHAFSAVILERIFRGELKEYPDLGFVIRVPNP